MIYKKNQDYTRYKIKMMGQRTEVNAQKLQHTPQEGYIQVIL